MNAHATGTPKGDVIESRLVSGLVGQRASVTSNKAVLGHTMGASGAIEAAMTVRTITERTVPPTANLSRLDPEVDLDVVTGAPGAQHVELARSCSGLGGAVREVLAEAGMVTPSEPGDLVLYDQVTDIGVGSALAEG